MLLCITCITVLSVYITDKCMHVTSEYLCECHLCAFHSVYKLHDVSKYMSIYVCLFEIMSYLNVTSINSSGDDIRFKLQNTHKS